MMALKTEPLIETAYRIFPVGDAAASRHVFKWPRDPGFDLIRKLVEPLLNGAHLEHVTVMHDGKRRDMFVDDEGLLKRLPRNDRATAIYRSNWISRHPGVDPETLNWIAGPAILFERIIWF